MLTQHHDQELDGKRSHRLMGLHAPRSGIARGIARGASPGLLPRLLQVGMRAAVAER